MPKSSNKQSQYKIDDVIHGNDINTYDVTVMDNFNKLSAVITKHLKELKHGFYQKNYS